MIVSIHQPHFLPWMGYFNKVLHSDVFVWLHSVQYRKNYYQNRTRIKDASDREQWLTLPVHASLGTRIDDVTIADSRWRERLRKTVEQCYRKTPYFAECWPAIENAMTQASDNLNEVNYRTFTALLQLLGGSSVRVENVGSFPAVSSDPTLRLVEICAALGASTYIAGKGGREYVREEEFTNAGIKVLWQEFEPTAVTYKQTGKVFVPGLSMIDCLFNTGPSTARELALAAWVP